MKNISLLLVLLMITLACLKREEYPIEPYIEFEDFIQMPGLDGGNKGLLVFSFTDGDGDIGLAPEDTLPPFHREGDYYYNLFIFYKYVDNNDVHRIEIPDTIFSPHIRLPVITPSGKNKAIRGEIEAEIFMPVFKDYVSYTPVAQGDTIVIDFYILDRAHHKSNTVRTPYIIVQ